MGRFRKTLGRFKKTLGQIQEDLGQIQGDFGHIQEDSLGSVLRLPYGFHFGFNLETLLEHLSRFVADTRFLKTLLP